MIKPPKKNIKKDVARALVEGVAQSNPLAGALARLYQTTHPSESEQDRDRWAQEVTDRINHLPSPIIASGHVELTALVADHGISSVTDNGTGDWHVNFDTAAQDIFYHVSMEVPRGQANVSNKTATGFRVRTSEDGQLIDTEFNFAVIGQHPHP